MENHRQCHQYGSFMGVDCNNYKTSVGTYLELKGDRFIHLGKGSLPSREGLTTPRSARAPIGRRPPSTLPHRLKKEKSLDSPPEMDSPGGSVCSDLRRQNEELRARLAGESADHKRRLEAYRRAQQGQAALVSRLQSKVLQYKQRCSELENQMLETTPRSEPSSTFRAPAVKSHSVALPPPPSATTCASAAVAAADARITDLETALRRLDEEKRKCEKLVQQNNLLRDQLEESHHLNEALTNDLQKLTNDWEALRDEMAIKEDEWKDEEQAFNDYYSNEHHRLLSLWREVVSVKRHFAELQTNTERDLYRVRNEFDSNARELSDFQPLSQQSSQQNIYPTQQQGGGYQGSQQAGYQGSHQAGHAPCMQGSQGHGVSGTGPYSVESMRVDLRDMTAQRDSALAELRERDARIQRLLGELQGLEERCESAEASCEAAGVMRAALEDVARALIHDSDADVAPAHAQHLHLHDRSPKRVTSSANATAFAESTISAVQAALHKYQIQIHELQVKLQNTREQLSTCRKHGEAADLNVASLESKVQDLQGKLDQANADLHQLLQEKESMQKTVEALRMDKNNLERNRVEINAMVESLTSDYEKLQKINSRLEKAIEALESDLEIELERTLMERSDLQDLVEKLEAAVRNLESDKKKLHDDVKHQGDLNSLRKELLAAEQTRMELEADKASLCEKIKFIEGERDKVELELRQVMRERGELSSQLTAMVRKKDTLNEEIIRLQQRLEQANETIGRINRALEDHVKDGEDKQILIDSLEKDKQHLQEQLAGVRSEKDALEAVLFDTANLLEDTDNKRNKLEHELQETLVQQENYKGNNKYKLEYLYEQLILWSKVWARERKLRDTRNSMSQASGKKEAEYQQIITNINRTTAENITKLKEEKEQLRQTLEHKLSQTIAALTSEKESCEASAREREKKLLIARDQLILQHDEAMLRAENDKQQALLMAHQEQQALLERLEEAKRAFDCEQNKLERVRRDAHARAEQDRTYVNQLKDEMAALKTRLEEAKASAEDECARYENRIKELHLEKEAVMRECTEIRAQLSLAEDKYDNAYAQLQDTMRKLKESDSLRKELTDVRRQLTNCTAERDKYNSSCRELRDHVKRAEHERREAARARDDAYHKIAESETGGEHVTRELKATENQLKRERAALEQANHDIKELQSRSWYFVWRTARLGGSEGRCRALEASLSQCESGKREAEAKLSSIAHGLRRVCGVQPDGPRSLGGSQRDHRCRSRAHQERNA
ncbi:hypothetical protein HF086_014043 [Spodoptera exigua]|uniref:Rootletin-like coiled-coil domain-containing protein n=1 Tax=Spodoptera exigua TaxID=7107 RepID=A0A922MLQ7_SPOEX|nr:hypothetical protein HF086_014043 [Spodoptera exigua]